MDRFETLHTLVEEYIRLEKESTAWRVKKADEGKGKTIASFKIEQTETLKEQTYRNMILLGFTKFEITVALFNERQRGGQS